jgi:hypothetical protein
MTAFFSVAASLLLSHTAAAVAESDALQTLRASAATVATNQPGIHTFAEPPAGFNPATASDLQLAVYGFPARPNPQTDPTHYAFWQRAVESAKTRWTGELTPLAYTRPVVAAAAMPEVAAATTSSSGPQQIKTDNAAGVILTNGLQSWNKVNSFVLVYAEITVPKAQMPFNSHSCSATDYTEVSLVGIDGADSGSGNSKAFNSKLQAGIYSDVPCNGTPLYYAELEYGDGGVSSVFPVNPGDVVDVTVEGLPGTSYIYLNDVTSETYGSYTIATPDIVGNSANWIVERLCCTGSLPYPLANTVGIAFHAAGAQTQAQFDSPYGEYVGSQASTTKVLTMMDNNGKTGIEVVSQGSAGEEGLTGLYFQTTGCAYLGDCPVQ